MNRSFRSFNEEWPITAIFTAMFRTVTPIMDQPNLYCKAESSKKGVNKKRW